MAKLSGIQKTAIVLTALDPDTAADLIKEFSDEQIAAISAEMANFERIDRELVDAVLTELTTDLKGSTGAVEYDNNSFKRLLEKAVGSEKTEEIISNIEEGNIFPTPFVSLRDSSDEELMRILAGEHPQTIALVLTYVGPERAGKVLSQLPMEFQAEIVMRIATMESPPVNLLQRVSEVISAKTKNESRRKKTPAKKKHKFASEVIGCMEGVSEKDVIDRISHKNPDLADEINKLLFTFADIVYVQDEAFRKILTEVDNSVIALALKTSNEEIENKFFNNMSKRVGDTIKEERDLLGPRLLSEVRDAQQQIVEAIKRLEAKGEAVINKRAGKSEDKFV
ncbi:MAG: flagellar motor switch protein FliG [Candidatus Brocadiaceae bacterium]|nr:flagellar motor switch protein FliG [Candidatus Brocadiaceae bacterium]